MKNFGKVKLLIMLGLGGILAIALSGALITVGKSFGQLFFGRNFAETQLREYVSRVLKQDVNGVSCQPTDSDGNGYVSCDFTTTQQPNVTRTLECAAWGLDGFLNRGCKSRLPGSADR
ncbi:MAG: hypothetical protein N5P05_000737 [Chroococcopsis gigantea SAG 12.99]|jgi:hypothetical protein|nr:hypothetical protein [Chlorogloea purpurea SAG 13.99]MDV2999131.1 hypothetical protein [Chroococcopsis gigantea SAG 12.99]